MAAARAVLKHIKSQGPYLQQELNQRTSQFVEVLNTYFQEDEIPFRIAHFGSLFGPASLGNSPSSVDFASSIGINLLSYNLLHRGILLRGGGGFLSTAHTGEDLDYIIQAVKDSVAELREGGFFLRPAN